MTTLYDTWICGTPDCGGKVVSMPSTEPPVCMDCDAPMLPAAVVSVAELEALRAKCELIDAARFQARLEQVEKIQEGLISMAFGMKP